MELVDRGSVEVCWLDHQHPPGHLLSRAEKIRTQMAGSGFGSTDSLILACAVLCPGADRLYTNDKRGMFQVPARLLRKADGKGLWLTDRFEG